MSVPDTSPAAPPEIIDGALQIPATSRIKADKLRSARAGARVALKMAADWLQSVGAPPDEVDALRAAWRKLGGKP